MPSNNNPNLIHLAVPKGRIEAGVIGLLGAAGIKLRSGPRGYRPVSSVPGYEVKLLKPQTIVEMLNAGSRDVGFTGADWVAEKDVDLVELLDTGLDPVQLVAAAPEALLVDGDLPDRPLVIAGEFQRLTKQWIAQKEMAATFVRSYGATEVFPPEDADVIVDITATGETLKANGLVIVEELLRSTTRLYASPSALDKPEKRAAIDSLVLSLRSVIEARGRAICGCIQQAANLTLTAKDQRLASSFYGDPQRAQDVRQSGRMVHARFWERYRNYAEMAEIFCG